MDHCEIACEGNSSLSINIEKLSYPPIISASEFDEAQANRKERSNLVTTEDGKKRKPVRYKSV